MTRVRESRGRYLRGPADDDEADLFNRLFQLRRFDFVSRYGDFMDSVCDELKFEQFHDLDRYWTEISNGITQEKSLWRQWQFGITFDEDVKTTCAVFNACTATGLDFDNVMRSIAVYADRNDNSLVRASAAHLAEQGKWALLIRALDLDLDEIRFFTLKHLRTEIPALRKTVQAVVDRYFDRSAKWPTTRPAGCRRKPTSLQRRQKMPVSLQRRQKKIVSLQRKQKNESRQRQSRGGRGRGASSRCRSGPGA